MVSICCLWPASTWYWSFRSCSLSDMVDSPCWHSSTYLRMLSMGSPAPPHAQDQFDPVQILLPVIPVSRCRPCNRRNHSHPFIITQSVLGNPVLFTYLFDGHDLFFLSAGSLSLSCLKRTLVHSRSHGSSWHGSYVPQSMPAWELFPTVRLQSNGLPACNLLRCRRTIGLATHYQMSKTRMLSRRRSV